MMGEEMLQEMWNETKRTASALATRSFFSF